jgi:hypothetical protein
MKTKLITLALVTLGLQNIKAQVTQTREINPFTKIQASGAVKVIYTHSDTLGIKVKGEENEIGFVKTNVDDNTLYISTNGSFKESIKVYVSHNGLKDLSMSGAVNFESRNTLKANEFNISLSGASNVDLEMNADKINSIQSGATSLKLAGTTNQFITESSGAASVKAFALNSKTTAVTTAGAASARVSASEKLTANATGASSIKFKGDAKDVVAEASTASSITKIVDENTSERIGKRDTTKGKYGDSVVINIRAKRIVIFDKNTKDTVIKKKKIDKDDFKHWQGLSLGVNGYLTPDADFSMAPKYDYMSLNYTRSINVQFNIFQKNWSIYKEYIQIATGFGIEWRRFMLDNKTTLNADSSFTWGVIDSTNTFKFTKNLFRSTLLQVPLLIEFNTNKNPKKAFHIAVGGVGQFAVGTRTKQKFERNNDEYEKIRKDNYNINPFVFKTHASIGYSNFTVFGEYNITSLFEKGKGPQLYPFTIGVRIIPI